VPSAQKAHEVFSFFTLPACGAGEERLSVPHRTTVFTSVLPFMRRRTVWWLFNGVPELVALT